MALLTSSIIFSGLLCGFLFGFVLENAGFGSPAKLTAQFRLSDWSVFKVMFMAIVVAATGLYVLQLAGVIQTDAIFVPPALLMAAGIGGALVGAGFAIGGYCPGTSVVGLFSGRLDAAVFLVGLVVGTFAFAGLYGATIDAIMAMFEVTQGDTVTEVFSIPQPVVLGGMIAALIAIFYVGSWFERRSNGPITAAQAVSGISPD
ncbi:MAG TPA: YeeE/YedE thiosulfate transporter family protein [Rugosibacter sp.]